nr:glutathione S-transferase family protein [Propylenella binzhouense]
MTLYQHPLASFCHKVLIALYENRTPFRAVTVDFADPGAAAAHFGRWPVGKIPVLHDSRGDRTIPETSIIIEYLQAHHPGPAPMLPDDAEARLEVRLWDRFFDLYVAAPMQKIVGDRLRPEGGRDATGVGEAHAMLDAAYGMLEARLAGRSWAAGGGFSLADCAAAPALFFATIVHPAAAEQRNLRAYVERLLDRPSFGRVLAEARPYFDLFPYRDAMPAGYLADRTG